MDSIDKKNKLKNINKKEKTIETITNHKDEIPPTTSNNDNNKPKKLIENSKLEKNNEKKIKKLEKENAHLRKLLINYKIQKNKYFLWKIILSIIK